MDIFEKANATMESRITKIHTKTKIKIGGCFPTSQKRDEGRMMYVGLTNSDLNTEIYKKLF